MTPVMTPRADTDTLNDLLRSEIAAVASFVEALDRLEDEHPARDDLRRMRDGHQLAVGALRERVRRYGGLPLAAAAAWDLIVAAEVVDPVDVLAALKQGEERGQAGYRAALEDDELAPECRNLIASELLPRCADHSLALDRLIGLCR